MDSGRRPQLALVNTGAQGRVPQLWVADAQAGLCSGHSPGAIRDILRRLEDMGCDEAILTPTTADLDELSATEDFVASL